MKIWFILFVVTILGLQVQARDVVGNGEEAAEKTIRFVYSHLETYIKTCVQTEACSLTQRQYGILSKIFNGLPNEKLNRDQLQFVSESKVPGFFIINDGVKIAKTGSQVAGSIYINSDLIYTKNSQGLSEPISIENAIALLIHELGHHYGDYTHEELDVLGMKLANVIQLSIYSTPPIPWDKNVYAIVINNKEMATTPDFLIYIYDDVIEATASLKSVVRCPSLVKPTGVLIYNLFWTSYAQGPHSNIFGIEANLMFNCKAFNIGAERSSTSRIKIEFETDNQKYKPGTLKILQR